MKDPTIFLQVAFEWHEFIEHSSISKMYEKKTERKKQLIISILKLGIWRPKYLVVELYIYIYIYLEERVKSIRKLLN